MNTYVVGKDYANVDTVCVSDKKWSKPTSGILIPLGPFRD